ncbi:hypothetical protein MC885_007002 [Smutsia gigantea]|nr:hypothetical protein MC885_007002 [Smutsia gigantea]
MHQHPLGVFSNSVLPGLVPRRPPGLRGAGGRGREVVFTRCRCWIAWLKTAMLSRDPPSLSPPSLRSDVLLPYAPVFYLLPRMVEGGTKVLLT